MVSNVCADQVVYYLSGVFLMIPFLFEKDTGRLLKRSYYNHVSEMIHKNGIAQKGEDIEYSFCSYAPANEFQFPLFTILI